MRFWSAVWSLRSCFDRVLVAFWSGFGQVLVTVWSGFGQPCGRCVRVLIVSWSRFGQVLVKFWSSFGEVLVSRLVAAFVF